MALNQGYPFPFVLMFHNLIQHQIFAIPAGDFFSQESGACYLVYSPLANLFFLAKPEEVQQLDSALARGETSSVLSAILNQKEVREEEVSPETFCTLHLLLNEKCNFNCSYCYSSRGRSSAELQEDSIAQTLAYFLSSDRHAVKDRTVMFMGGGEPMLSWPLLKKATVLAETMAKENGIGLHLSLTTNGSILTEEMLDFLNGHAFTVQVSFEILPDVQNAQRGMYTKVAANLNRMLEKGINCYVRSTITALNVDRIPEMVRYSQAHFPLLKSLSCQQVVDPETLSDVRVTRDFFDRYRRSFNQGEALAKEFGITLRSSSSHLINYSKRIRFCYNLLCLTPYGTLMTCPDVSSPQEPDYEALVIGKVTEKGLEFDQESFDRLTQGSIFTYAKCRDCFARWNCGSGCPANRRVYREEVFDCQCDYYRKMLLDSLISELAKKYEERNGGDFYRVMAQKLAQ